jgi:hypothetical protein
MKTSKNTIFDILKYKLNLITDFYVELGNNLKDVTVCTDRIAYLHWQYAVGYICYSAKFLDYKHYILQREFLVKHDRAAGVFKKNERCKIPTALVMY